MGRIILLLIVAAFAYGIYQVVTGGLSAAKFVLRIGTAGATLKGSVPGKSDSDVIDFVDGLGLESGNKIWGVPDGDTLRVRFSDGIPANLQQRIRNYFLN